MAESKSSKKENIKSLKKEIEELTEEIGFIEDFVKKYDYVDSEMETDDLPLQKKDRNELSSHVSQYNYFASKLNEQFSSIMELVDDRHHRYKTKRTKKNKELAHLDGTYEKCMDEYY